MPDKARDAIDLIRQEEDTGQWFDLSGWKLQALLVLLGLCLLLWLFRAVRKCIRGRRPPRLHPNLQKYAGKSASDGSADPELAAKRRSEAARIMATSSTPGIVGYEIVRQIEAVYVDGFRRPEEATEGLKAVAAMKGANALTNVRTSRDAAGKYAAAGDAVLVKSKTDTTAGATVTQPMDGNEAPESDSTRCDAP
ncbi:MAG: hypothetical protein J5J06_03950 [Phycisphaerae bacterium]|nr:hypothetical protein [Phycisphaerae bacterium]